MSAVFFPLAFGFAVIYALRWSTRPLSWPRSGVKTVATGLLALASVPLGAPPGVTLGLALGAAGDLALSRPGDRAFLAGMAAFAAGHLAYAWVFLAAGTGDPLVLPTAAMLLLAVSTEIWLAPYTGALQWPVRGYVVVITLMMLAALTLPGRALLVMAGTALFVLSDLLLALQMFRGQGERAWLSRTVWACYWGGQALITLGAAALVPASGG